MSVSHCYTRVRWENIIQLCTNAQCTLTFNKQRMYFMLAQFFYVWFGGMNLAKTSILPLFFAVLLLSESTRDKQYCLACYQGETFYIGPRRNGSVLSLDTESSYSGDE